MNRSEEYFIWQAWCGNSTPTPFFLVNNMEKSGMSVSVYGNVASVIRTSKVVEKCGNKHSICTPPMKPCRTTLCIALRWYHHVKVDVFFRHKRKYCSFVLWNFIRVNYTAYLNYTCDYLDIMDRISIISAHIAHIVNNIDCAMPFVFEFYNFYWKCGIQV